MLLFRSAVLNISHQTSVEMTGSNIFSFASTRRKPKPLIDTISSPCNSAEVKHRELKRACNDSRSSHAARDRRAKQHPSSGPSQAGINTYIAASQYSLTTSTGTECLENSPTKSDRPAGSLTASDLHRSQLRKQQSSGTISSYYDRRKSPLVVSQQTSASSARDLALRKGCPPIIPKFDSDGPCPTEPESTILTDRGQPKKRPSRLDFSMLFQKSLPRSGPLLSPHRYTNSPPPLSTTSETRFEDPQTQSFLDDDESSEVRERVPPHHMPHSQLPPRMIDPSFAKITAHRPGPRLRNWFDGLEGDISDDEADGELATRPDIVETAFRSASSKASSQNTFPPTDRSGKQVRPDQGNSHQSSRGRKSIQPVVKGGENSQLYRSPHKWQGKTEGAFERPWDQVDQLQRSGYITLNFADLHEESVLCLSSSDDENEISHIEGQRQNVEQREPFLRDSLVVDSIDSDVEVGTAQAVHTSFLRTSKPLAQSRNRRGNASTKSQAKVQRLKAVEIPDRRSSRQGVPRNYHQMISCGSDDGFIKASSVAQSGHESLSSKSSTRTAAKLVAPTQNMLVMTLTPQEASFLEAMRSNKASTPQDVPKAACRAAAREDPHLKPTSKPHLSFDNNFRPSPIDKRPVRADAELLDAKKRRHVNRASTEASLASVRGSLMFSESVSSPTTSRNSPTTPALDSDQELSFLYGLGDSHDSSLHTVKANHFGHTRCRTGSSQIILLDNFPQPQKHSIASEEYPWVFGQFDVRAKSTMIH